MLPADAVALAVPVVAAPVVAEPTADLEATAPAVPPTKINRIDRNGPNVPSSPAYRVIQVCRSLQFRGRRFRIRETVSPTRNP